MMYIDVSNRYSVYLPNRFHHSLLPVSIDDYACFEILPSILFQFLGAPAQRNARLSVQQLACDRLLRGYVTHFACVR